MAVVNNATGVYATLGYNFSDPNGIVQTFSANTQSNLQQFPPVIESWQAQDMASNSVGGYFQNPVANSVNTIISIAQQIYILANDATSNANTTYTGTANLAPLVTPANTLYNDATSFLVHTNKISGVTPMTGATDTATNPYYQTAVAFGKQAIMITNQTDGIVNNSPIIGSMSSILVTPQITAYANTLSADLVTLTYGISHNTLSNAQVTQISTDLTNTDTYMNTRRNSDVTFFQNIQTFTNNYNSTQQFSNMGDTEIYLCNNVVGTPKLISRINS
jgi:hypothetical protein